MEALALVVILALFGLLGLWALVLVYETYKAEKENAAAQERWDAYLERLRRVRADEGHERPAAMRRRLAEETRRAEVESSCSGWKRQVLLRGGGESLERGQRSERMWKRHGRRA